MPQHLSRITSPPEIIEFIRCCLVVDPEKRPEASQLLEMPFLQTRDAPRDQFIQLRPSLNSPDKGARSPTLSPEPSRIQDSTITDRRRPEVE